MADTPEYTQYGIYEAKMHLSELIERVENGESFIITKYGKPVATINTPPEVIENKLTPEQATKNLDEFAAYMRELNKGEVFDWERIKAENRRGLL